MRTRPRAPPTKLYDNLHQHTTNETKVNMSQCADLFRLYLQKPALVSARMVLQAQLLSAGLTLRRNGEIVDLTSEFRRHVDCIWLPFAKSVIDSVIALGFCVVSYELDTSQQEITLPTKHEQVKQENHSQPGTSKTVVPNVASIGSYQLAFCESGASGYGRQYKVYAKTTGYATVHDENVRVFVREHPQQTGEITSAVASIATMSRFTDDLLTLAMKTETGRAAPAIVTQERRAGGGSGANNPSDMFFDSESRDIHTDGIRREDEQAAMALQLQMQFCRTTNARNAFDPRNPDVPWSGSSSKSNSINPPTLTLPKSHELASYPLPQARTDLGDLLRFTQDQMCSAMGVPSGLLFDSGFAGKSTAQLSLLNSTIQQLSHTLNTILTQAYHDIYGNDSPNGDISFTTTVSPLSSAEEVVKLFSSGLADFKVAAPLALHAVGASMSEIEAALERQEGVEKQKHKLLQAQQQNEGAPSSQATPSKSRQRDTPSSELSEDAQETKKKKH